MKDKKTIYLTLLLTGLLLAIAGITFLNGKSQLAVVQAADTLPNIKIIFFTPETENYIDKTVLDLVDPSLLIANNISQLVNTVESENPQAIVIDSNAIDLVDNQWLKEQYNQGVVLGVLNGKQGQLSVKLGLISANELASQPASPNFTTPYIRFVYDYWDPALGLGMSGRGILELDDVGDFLRKVQSIEEAKIYNIETNNLNK
ncbi:MAG: hypothetical protein Fur0022_45760 [Anaerolineales bacterium]